MMLATLFLDCIRMEDNTYFRDTPESKKSQSLSKKKDKQKANTCGFIYIHLPLILLETSVHYRSTS